MVATARRAPFCSAAPHLSNAVHHQLRRQIVRPADRYMRRCQDRLYSLVSAGSRQPRQPRFTARPDRPEARRHAEPDRDGLAATTFPAILPIPGTSSIAHLEESLASAPLGAGSKRGPCWCAAYSRLAYQGLSRSSGAPDPDWLTRPGPSLVFDGGQRMAPPGGMRGLRCASLSLGLVPSRSRRSSSMRARMVAKSSAARGRFTAFPPFRLVSF